MCFLTFSKTYSQDLERIGRDKPVKISGMLSATGIGYTANGIQNRRPPLSYFLSGNVNIDLYGWSIPISATYSNQQAGFRQPFNQYGLSPKYKWITLHAGYRTLTYSPYTLNGHIFLGGGVDLAPGNFRFSAMYGRLNKAVNPDTNNSKTVTPAFETRGYGMKVGYEKNGDNLYFNFFRAKDRLNSIRYVPENSEILPAENLVYGINGRKKLGERLVVTAEYAKSAFTRDIRSEAISPESNILASLLTTRTSTTFHKAMKGTLVYNASTFSLQLGYERVDPEYRTLGSYFFNNDFENITLGGAKPLFKNKLTISANGGVQRNNLLNTQMNTIKRIVGGVNLTFVPNSKWNILASYSNFTVNTRLRPAFDQFNNLDSLNLTQITQSGNLNTSYNFGDKERKKNINLNVSYQQANNNKGDNSRVTQTTFINSNLAYRFNWVRKDLSVVTSVNVNKSDIGTLTIFSVGPVATVTKSFLEKKIKTGFTVNYNKEYQKDSNGSRLLNLRVNGSYLVGKKHNMTILLVMLNRKGSSGALKAFTEYTGTLGYSYTF